MRLSCFELGIDIHFEENKVNVLVVENQKVFAEFLEKLMQNKETEKDEIILSEGESKLIVHKCMDMVYSPLLVDLNSKRILTRLYQEITEIVNEEFSEEKEAINAGIITFLDNLLLKLPYPLTFNLDMDLVALFKQYDIRMELENVSLLERLVNYIHIEQMLCGTKVIVFINIKDYLDNEQLQELYKTAFYHKIHLLLIESKKKDVLSGEKYCIIDKDRCVIEL